MANFVFDYGRGRVAEKVADAAANLGILLIKTSEGDTNMKTRTTVADILAHSTEADFTNYARKTGLTGTITVDTTGHTVAVSIPDQTWSSAGGATNNTLVKLIVYYQDSAADSGRIPLVGLDFAPTTDGTDLQTSFNASGFWSAA